MKLRNLIESKLKRGNYDNLSSCRPKLTELPADMQKKFFGDFNCSDNELTSLKFGPVEIGKKFNCAGNKLTSLEYGPIQVGGSYTCSVNELTSLEHCPSNLIGGFFDCSYNQLTSLAHCPTEVGGDFFCYGNHPLTSLDHINLRLKKISGSFVCYDCNITSSILGLMLIEIGGHIRTNLGDGKDVDVILNRWKNQGRNGVMRCQRDLNDAGYRELAQL